MAWFLSWCACCWWWRFRPFRGFPGALGCSSGLQDGHLRCSKSEDSFRIDFRQKMWQSTSIVACFGLVSSVVCVLLVVAIYDMNEGGENDDDGMDEEEEESDGDDMEEE